MDYRVLQIVSSSQIGGTERQVVNLVRHIDRLDFEPSIISTGGNGPLMRKFRGSDVNFGYVGPHYKWLTRDCLRWCIRDWEIDLVHIYGLRANVLFRRLCKRAGAKVVSAIRNTDPWRKWYHVWLDRLTARYVDLWISNSEVGRLVAIEREKIRPGKVVTVHNGVEKKRLIARDYDQDVLRLEFHAVGCNPVVAVIANLRPQKRHCDLVDAAVLLAREFPSIVFLCAGVDWMKGEVQDYAAARQMSRHFRWLGYVEDVDKVIAASDFTVLPSDYEGFPCAILEAMAMGRTVVATSVGGTPELVRDNQNGLLVPPRSVPHLCRAIETLATMPTFRSCLEGVALWTAQNEFSIDRMVRGVEDAYLGLLEP